MTPTPTEQALQTLRKARPFVQSYVKKHPKWEFAGQMQDPSGSHALVGELDAAIAAIESAPTGAAQAAPSEPPQLGVHLSHCNFGENAGGCKYMDDNCPALSESWSWFGKYLQRADKIIADAAQAAGEVPQDTDRNMAGTPPAEPGAEVPMPEPDAVILDQWMPLVEAMRLGKVWTTGCDFDNSPQWRAVVRVLLDEVERLRTYGDSRAAAAVAADRTGRRPLTDEQIDRLNGLDTAGRVRFYEHDFYVLSNFSAFRLEWQGEIFDTSEAAYHAEKFWGYGMVHTSWDLIRTIREAPSAHEAFKIAERNKSLRRPDWDGVKVGIMKRILRAKADQHEYVRRKLLATGDRELVEDSWRDDFWGWGENHDGKNMLGKLWMEVRSELRGIQAGE